MKKLLVAFVLSMTLFACGKLKSDQQCNYPEVSTVAPDSEAVKLKTYLDTSFITAQKAPSGLYYIINSQGSGASVVNLCSQITVNYKGKLTNGTTFDSTVTNTPVSFALGSVILGWQKGIPLINKGGHITLFIPPSLGYGPGDVKDQQGHVIIPGNSILIFDVEVVDISG